MSTRHSRNCRRRIRILSSTARNAAANTRMTITKMIAGTASAVSFDGSKQNLQDARARLAQPLSRLHEMSELRRWTLSTGDAELQNCSARSVTAEEQANGATRAAQLTLPEFAALPISDARDFLADIEVPPDDGAAAMLRDEICARLRYLCEVGVGYLTLDRSTRTLSGGEMQRVNLTTCLGASLVNTLFVMDEPSVGLHPRDVGRLVRVMHNLRDKGNTLLVVEHEEQIIRAADNLIDIGPGRGERGGELVWSGRLDEFMADGRRRCRLSRSIRKSRLRLDTSPAERPIHQSLTRDYLTVDKSIPIPKSRRKFSSRYQNHRRDRAQSQEPRRRNSTRDFHLRHRRFRFRKIDSDSGRAVSESFAGAKARRANMSRAHAGP